MAPTGRPTYWGSLDVSELDVYKRQCISSLQKPELDAGIYMILDIVLCEFSGRCRNLWELPSRQAHSWEVVLDAGTHVLDGCTFFVQEPDQESGTCVLPLS